MDYMSINTANNIIGRFGIRHNTETFMETIELLDDYNQKGLLMLEERIAYLVIIDEMAEYHAK